MKLLILNDGINYENWGIKACIDGLKSLFNEAIEHVEIEGLPHSYMHKKYSWEPKLLGKNILNEKSRIAPRILNEFHILPVVADEFDYVADLWEQGKGGPGADHFIKTITHKDVIVFNAEGSTYRNNIGALKGLFMLWYAKNRANKTCYFMNGSVTLTLVDATLPAMIQKTFNSIDGVAVREPYSARNIKAFYPEIKLQVIPDSVFALDLIGQASLSRLNFNFPREPFFCFSLSMLPMDFRRTLDKSKLVILINRLKKIVPNAILLAKDVEDQVITDVCRLTNSQFVGPEYSYQEISYILSKAKFLFSGRYHHLIFATKVGCPVIPMASSSHKIHGLADLFGGLMPTPIDPTNLKVESDKITEIAKTILTDKGLSGKYLQKSEQLSTWAKYGTKELIALTKRQEISK